MGNIYHAAPQWIFVWYHIWHVSSWGTCMNICLIADIIHGMWLKCFCYAASFGVNTRLCYPPWSVILLRVNTTVTSSKSPTIYHLSNEYISPQTYPIHQCNCILGDTNAVGNLLHFVWVKQRSVLSLFFRVIWYWDQSRNLEKISQ